ncbi:MAG: N-acetyl-gamma-glutamyl-phosphate reductase [Phycisphaerales bacterium JB037]
MHASIPVAIAGAAGYTGQELVRLALGHPELEIVGLFGSESGAAESYADRCPSFRGLVEDPIQPTSAGAIIASGAKVALLATPHELSAHLAPELLDAGLTVIDISGGFRLAAEDYPKWYGFAHPCPDLLAEAVYGLPEINREALAGASLVGVAGCYPTSAIVPLRALTDAGALAPGSRAIINSVSGASGAGRKASEATSLCEVSLKPYNIGVHRHQPEIDRYARLSSLFVPHIAPFKRGIVSTIHVQLAEGWTRANLTETLQSRFSHEPFVRLLPGGVWPSVGAVEHTNCLDLGWFVEDQPTDDQGGPRVVVVSAIDNLIKGASGQAIQCLNLAMGLDETAGLLPGGLSHSFSKGITA